MGRGVWADGQDIQELLEDDLAGKLVQLESIWLPATGQDMASQQPVHPFMVFVFYIFGNVQRSKSWWLIFYDKIKTFNYSIYSFHQPTSPPPCLC